MLKKIFIPISIILSIILILLFLRFVVGGSEDSWICVNGEWVEHGVPSAPRPEESCGNKIVDLEIKIDRPQVNELITSPLVIEGEARGNWFFEGDSPVFLVDGDGNGIVYGFVTAKEGWMTSTFAEASADREGFVKFEGGFTFQVPETPTGTLIFMKDNPSGLPENSVEVRIPVRFK